jgi:nucleoside recognition membrane protein YjiH
LFCAFTVCLVVFSNSNLVAAKAGLVLWANNVVPSLFPFFIATELLSHTNVINKIGKFLNPIMRPIFNVPRLWCLCSYYGNN